MTGLIPGRDATVPPEAALNILATAKQLQRPQQITNLQEVEINAPASYTNIMTAEITGEDNPFDGIRTSSQKVRNTFICLHEPVWPELNGPDPGNFTV